MNKHTPGPWVVNPKNAQVDVFTESGLAPVCKLLWPTDLRSEDETEANAHLIAAAPDLLYVVRRLIEVAGGDPVMSVGHFVEHVCAARAAIAKARGEV